jgi:hypothetical protein
MFTLPPEEICQARCCGLLGNCARRKVSQRDFARACDQVEKGLGNLLAATTTAATTTAIGPPGGRHKAPQLRRRTHDETKGKRFWPINTKTAPATKLSRGLEFEAIREITRKAGVTCNNTPDTPTL